MNFRFVLSALIYSLLVIQILDRKLKNIFKLLSMVSLGGIFPILSESPIFSRGYYEPWTVFQNNQNISNRYLY